MDILVSFEDGSSAYLEHHGVKGMHWGVRNAETQARYAGGSSPRKSNNHGLSDTAKRRLKIAAVGVGTAAALGGAVYLGRRAGLGKVAKTYARRANNAKQILIQNNRSGPRNTVVQRRKTESIADFKEHAKMGMTPKKYEGPGLNKAKDRRIAKRIKADTKFVNDIRNHREFNRQLYEISMADAKRHMNRGRRIVNGLSLAGSAGALGAGAGAAYTSNKYLSRSK